MGSLTKQPSRELNPTPVPKRFSQGNTTRPCAEPSSQKSPGQGSRPKGRGSVESNGPSPGHLDNRTDSETSHGDDYQHHQTSKDIWDILFRPGPGDTKEDVKPLLLKTQYPTLLSPTELQSLEQPSPPPNKPLPKIPTQARPRTVPQQVPREVEDRQAPAWNPQNTRPRARKAEITYSPFLNLMAFTPRTTSLTPSWQSCRETHKPNRLPRSGATATKQAHRNIADHDLSKEKEKAIEELHKEDILEHLAPVARNSPVQKSDTGSYRQIFIHPLDDVIMHTEVEVAQPSTRSPSGLAVFLPPVEYDWDKNTPISCQPSSPKDLRLKTYSGTSHKAAASARRPTTASQKSRPKLTARGRRPAGASLGSGTKTSYLGSRRTAISETSPKTLPLEGPISVVLATSRSATHLPMSGSKPGPVLTKRSAPNPRRAAKPDPLQLPPLYQIPLPLEPTQSPRLGTPMHSYFNHHNVEEYKLFGVLRIHSRGNSGGRISSKESSLGSKWYRSKSESAPTSLNELLGRVFRYGNK